MDYATILALRSPCLICFLKYLLCADICRPVGICEPGRQAGRQAQRTECFRV